MRLEDFDALSFDCYGTLIDWETGILNALSPWRSRCGVAASDEQLLARYAEVESRIEAQQPTTLYPDILRAVLDEIARALDTEATEAELADFSRSVQDWPAFPDSPAALAYLKQHYKLVIVSNIDHASFAHSRAKLGVAFDAVVTAEDVGRYKPDPRNFTFALDRMKEMGIRRDRVLHVAQSLFHDHVPAQAIGLRSVWVNRRAGKSGTGATRAVTQSVHPDLVVNDMAGLAELHRTARQG